MGNKTVELLKQIIHRLEVHKQAFQELEPAFGDICLCVREEIEVRDLSASVWEDVHKRLEEIQSKLMGAKSNIGAIQVLEESCELIEYAESMNQFFIHPVFSGNGMWKMDSMEEHYEDKRYLFMKAEFERFMKMLENGENFSLLRWGDGERSILTKEGVTAQEGWSVPAGEEAFGNALMKSLMLQNEMVWHGISCPCCDAKAYYWYQTHMKSRQLTFANLWVNCNYQNFIKRFSQLQREAVVIGNAQGKGYPIGKLNILDYYEISDDCMDFFYHDLDELIDKVREAYGQRDNLLYVISAGPLSEIIIERLFNNNPNNCYIDFGSCLDIYIHRCITRPYAIREMDECFMHNPVNVSTDVSVVMTLYKRPETLLEQLEAVENQTLKPKEILLFQDAISGYYSIALKEEIKKRFQNVKICDENVGVWGRFEYANSVTSEYVCVLDDDTIPGSRWLENCHMHTNQTEGLYGTIGIMLQPRQQYPMHGYFRIGWAAPRQRVTEVDLVGHAWFFKKEYLRYMFDEQSKDFQKKYKYVGEDLYLSYSCRKHGINTFVPIHYLESMDYWGSIPKTAMRYGTQDVAVSLASENLIRMNLAVTDILLLGGSLIATQFPTYKEYVLGDVIDMEQNALVSKEDIENKITL